MTTSIMPRSFMNSACKHRPFKKRLHTVDIQKLEPLIMEVSEPENLSNKPQDLSVRRAESPVSPPPLVISTTPSPPPMASLPTPPPTHHHLFMKPLTTGVLEPLSLNHPMVEPCWPPQQSRTLPMMEQTYTIMPRGNYFGHPDSPNYTGLRVAKRTPVTTLYPPQPPAQRATSLSPLMQSRITYQPIYPSTSSASTFSDSTAELNLLSPSSSSASSASSTEVLGVEDLSRPAKGGKSCSSGQKYSCQACNKTYSSFSGLNKHRMMLCPAEDDQTNNNAALKSFSCKYCEKTYVSLGALKMHIRTHTLPCKCKLCGKAFSRPWLLQGHIRTHTGEKPFSCQHCRRAFADRSNLRAHLQTHSDVKKYSCPNCSKTFSRMSLLGKHLDGGCPGISQHSVDSIIIQQQMQAVH